MGFWNLIYTLYKNKVNNMKSKGKKEKVIVSLSIDKKLDSYMNEMFENKSKYIEWLIEQDLGKSGIDISKIIL